MTAARDEAARLRRCRLLFQAAQAAHCSMGEARRQDAEARWAESDRRLAGRRCGTVAAPDAAAGEQWWQR